MKILQHHPAMSEWLVKAQFKDAEKFRKEDIGKIKRLSILKEVINFPHLQPSNFTGREVYKFSPAFANILKEKGEKNCAFRIEPVKRRLPKLRTRGITLKDAYYKWFRKLKFNHDDYRISISFYENINKWCFIIVVKKEGILGEIIKGHRAQISQGETKEKLYQFLFDYKRWEFSENDIKVEKAVKNAISYLYVPNKLKQVELKKRLGATFSNNYLNGYFEAIKPHNEKIDYYDYNRLLPTIINIPKDLNFIDLQKDKLLKGVTAYPGFAVGKAVIINDENIKKFNILKKDSIIVCDNTDVRYIPLMKKATAIVTNRGSILSHAAIIARELEKPCIVNTKNATSVLETGDLIELDADSGIINKIG